MKRIFMHINRLPLDTLITGLGRLYKYEDKPWFINLWGESGGSTARYNTSFSHMHLLAKHRIINSTKNEHRKSGFHLKFRCPLPTKWISFAQSKSQLHFFRFDALATFSNELQTVKQVHVELSQLELARACFFQNAYLTRSALELNVLAEDFDIQNRTEHYLINVLPSCESSLALSHFNKPEFRRFLAYLLLNKNMRASYESIAQQCKAFESINNTIRTWNFSFIPPNLTDVNIEAYGYYDKLTNTFKIDEIIGFSGLSTHIDKPVYFYHNKFSNASKKSDICSTIPPNPNYTEPKLNDEEEATPNNKPSIVDAPTILLDFDDPFETGKVADKTGSKNVVIMDDTQEYIDELIGDVNADEPGIGGTAKAGDFEGTKDQTDDANLYLNRFSAFIQMLYKLEEKYGIQYSLILKVLPKIEGFTKHLKTDDSPRCIAEVHFFHQGQHFILLEVDTSDNSTHLSTQLLIIKDMNSWEEDYEKIRKFVVQKTLNWPKSFIKKITIQQIRFNHPHIDESQKVSIENLESWANRIYLGLNR